RYRCAFCVRRLARGSILRNCCDARGAALRRIGRMKPVLPILFSLACALAGCGGDDTHSGCDGGVTPGGGDMSAGPGADMAQGMPPDAAAPQCVPLRSGRRFTVVAVPDTQYLFDQDRGNADVLAASLHWIVEHACEYNIV